MFEFRNWYVISPHISLRIYSSMLGTELIHISTRAFHESVLSKVQIPRSPNGPPMVDDWVVRITFGWSVYVVVKNDNKTLDIN